MTDFDVGAGSIDLENSSLYAGIRFKEGSLSRSKVNRAIKGTPVDTAAVSLDRFVRTAHRKLEAALSDTSISLESLNIMSDTLADSAYQRSEGIDLLDRNNRPLSGVPLASRLAAQFEQAATHLDDFVEQLSLLDRGRLRPLADPIADCLEAITRGVEHVYNTPSSPNVSASSFPSISGYRDGARHTPASAKAVAAYDKFCNTLRKTSSTLRYEFKHPMPDYTPGSEPPETEAKDVDRTRSSSYNSLNMLALGGICLALGGMGGAIVGSNYFSRTEPQEITQRVTDDFVGYKSPEEIAEGYVPRDEVDRDYFRADDPTVVQLPYVPHDQLTLEFRPDIDANLLHIDIVDPTVPKVDGTYRAEVYLQKVETP